VDILGPVKSPLSKIAKQYRWQLLLKCSNVTPLHQFVYQLLHKNPSMFNKRDVKVVIDVDPFSLM
jgi:primosomal protein N' (replication factor Y)